MNPSIEETDPRVSAVFETARRLSPAERARLVGLVLASLDEPDPAIEAAWQAEAERRADGMDDGSRSATAWSEARKTFGL